MNTTGAYIPPSYGSKYKNYHKDDYNKPFTQQKGDYLYDMYEHDVNIRQKQQSMNNSILSNNNNVTQQPKQINNNNSFLSNNQSLYNTNQSNYNNNGYQSYNNNNNNNMNTNRTLNLDLSKSILVKDESFIGNNTMDRSLINNLSTRNFQNNNNKNDNIYNSNRSYLNNTNNNLNQSINSPSNYNNLNNSNNNFIRHNINATKNSFYQTSISKKNLLTDRATKNPSVFNTIAQENIFTNISYQANKDYDFSYDPRDGFNIKIDKVEIPFPATQIKNLKLSYEIVDKDTEQSLFQEYAKSLHYDDINKQHMNIEYSRNIKNYLVNLDYFIFIYADYTLYDLQDRIQDYFSSFTYIPIFRKEGLNSGCHQLNFLQQLSNSDVNKPLRALDGHQFPLAPNIKCYIRICRPKSTLDMQIPNVLKDRYKENLATERQERHEQEGFWVKKQKQQEEELMKEYQQHLQKYPQKKPKDKNNGLHKPTLSYDLVPPSRYAHFTTQVPRKPVYGYNNNGQVKFDHYV